MDCRLRQDVTSGHSGSSSPVAGQSHVRKTGVPAGAPIPKGARMSKLLTAFGRQTIVTMTLMATLFASTRSWAQAPLGLSQLQSPSDGKAAPAPQSPPAFGGNAPRQPQPVATEPEPLKPGEKITQITAPKTKLTMIVLDSIVVEFQQMLKIVDGHNPDVVNIQAIAPNQLRIRAEEAGITTVKLIDENDTVRELEILVEVDTRELEAYIRRLFPGSAIEVYGIRDAVVLRGWVTDPTHIPRIIDVAETFVPKVHNQLDVAGTNQIQLHVKVIEVQRSKLREFGFNLVSTGQRHFANSAIGGLGGLTGPTSLPLGTPPVTGVSAGSLSNSEFAFGITGGSDAFQGFVKALQSEALAKTLAEPVLITTSGRPASMLAGGSFPVLIPSGQLGTATIQYKEFGIRLDAVPITLGNGRLRLDISPEVSDRDFSSGVSFNGLSVPGVSTRKVNTQVELRFGETLMIGGLISTRRSGTTQKVPVLGELPYIGTMFSRKKYDWGETELLILVTPQMASALNPMQVPQFGPGQLTEDPIDKELYFDGFLEIPRYGVEGGELEYQPEFNVQTFDLNSAPLLPDDSADAMLPPDAQPAAPEGTIDQMSGSGGRGRVVPAMATSPDLTSSPRKKGIKAESDASPPGLIGPGSRR